MPTYFQRLSAAPAKGRVVVTTVSGQQHWCEGTGLVEVTLRSGHTVAVEVLVVAEKPLGFAFILGMNGVEAMDGVTVCSRHKVRFGVESAGHSLHRRHVQLQR